MADRAFVSRTRERVASERERLRESVARFDVVDPSPDSPLHRVPAPFLLLDAGASDRVDAALDSARQAGLALRDARSFEGLDSHLRVAVRRPAENDRLLAVLADV